MADTDSLFSLARQELEKLAQGQEPWKKDILSIFAASLENLGPLGLQFALDSIQNAKIKKIPDINWDDLESSSNVLAILENMEADHNLAIQDYAVKIGYVLSKILTSLLKGILS